jgi:large subunit ribosomal protein L1
MPIKCADTRRLKKPAVRIKMSIKVGSVTEAIKKAKEVAKKRKFVQSVDLTVNLKGLDLKKPENRINEIVKLPIALSKTPRICIIAYGDLAVKAKDLKMERIINKEELDSLTDEKKTLKKLAKDFDFFIARTDMMPAVGKVMGKYLAPRGKMPKPIPADGDLEAMVKEYTSIASIRLRKDPIFHVRIGTEDMDDEKITQNAMAVFNLLENKLTKGYDNIKNIIFKTTMGKPVKLEVR